MNKQFQYLSAVCFQDNPRKYKQFQYIFTAKGIKTHPYYCNYTRHKHSTYKGRKPETGKKKFVYNLYVC